MPIKVLIVDDSALIRSVLKEIIESHKDMKVVGAAPDPFVAREMIKALNPDVITLDVEMPRMDGLDFLEKLMRLRPMPVVMISTLTEKGSDITFRALELGAVDFISKPKLDISRGLQEYSDEIADKIRAAAKARPRKAPAMTVQKSLTADAILPSLSNHIASTEKLIIVGASTGGTEAIKEFLIKLPPDCPGIVITQHMPEAFTKSFAQRLDTPVQDFGERSRKWRPHPARPCLYRAGTFPLAGKAQRRQLRLRAIRRTARQSPPPLGGRPVPFRREPCGQKCDRRDSYRHGQGWRQGDVGDEAGRRLQLRPG